MSAGRSVPYLIGLATLGGLAAAAVTIWSVGPGAIAHSIARIGPLAFLGFCLVAVVTLVLLGAAWLVVTPDVGERRLGLFTAGRLVREGVADLLPLSQLGGIYASVRFVARAGIEPNRLYASFLADVTAELVTQTVFTAAALGSLWYAGGEGHAEPLRVAGLYAVPALAALAAILVAAQRLGVGLATSLAGRLLPASVVHLQRLQAELARIYAARNRVAWCLLLNLLAWIASATGALLLVRWAGAPVPVPTMLAVESIIFAVRSVAFAVPAAIGFQEAAYAVAGPLLGLPADLAVALSLAKRARELLLGAAGLIVWQWMETRGRSAAA